MAERVGDVLITCSSNLTGVSGQTADRATIVVDYGVPVTSHADTVATVVSGTSYYPSEAILLIDEPTTLATAPVAGYGQGQGITGCAFNGACPAFLQIQAGYYTMANAAAAPFAPTANVYQGALRTGTNNTKVTFLSVPILEPGPNATRVYRISNVRVTPGSGAITPTVTVTAAASSVNGLALSNNSTTSPVGTPVTSMTTSVSSVGGISLCVSPIGGAPVVALGTNNKLSLVTFKETFNNAWKTQTLPVANAAYAAENPVPATQVSGTGSYTYGSSLLSETGTYNATTAGGVAIGLADYGTRFKIVLSGLPQITNPGTQFWISTTNVTDLANGLSAPANIGGQTQGAYAVMVGQSGAGATDLTAVERTAFGAIVAPTLGASYTNPVNNTTINFTQVFPATASTAGGAQKGQAEVVYELTNLTKGALNTLNFALYVSYTNGINAPATGNTATVQAGYAPFDNSTTLVPATFVPRFTATTTAASTFFNVLPCQTSLLFPYVVASSGYATGMAIANTSADPYTTGTSTGKCALNFYSSATPATYTTGDVAPGTTYTAYLTGDNQLYESTAPVTLTGFTGKGYMFATCNFKYAHGFAFITSRDGLDSAMAMGYVANVINGSDRGIALTGESLAN